MRETTVLFEVVCAAEPAEAPNGADFALRLRRDDELCAHDGESRIGGFDASESDGRTRHARRGRLHTGYGRKGRPIGRHPPSSETLELGGCIRFRPIGRFFRPYPLAVKGRAPAAYQ